MKVVFVLLGFVLGYFIGSIVAARICRDKVRQAFADAQRALEELNDEKD